MTAIDVPEADAIVWIVAGEFAGAASPTGAVNGTLITLFPATLFACSVTAGSTVLGEVAGAVGPGVGGAGGVGPGVGGVGAGGVGPGVGGVGAGGVGPGVGGVGAGGAGGGGVVPGAVGAGDEGT